MTKAEKREANHTLCLFAAGLADAGYAARCLSALARATKTEKNKNEIITLAAGYPAIVQSSEFIVA